MKTAVQNYQGRMVVDLEEATIELGKALATLPWEKVTEGSLDEIDPKKSFDVWAVDGDGNKERNTIRATSDGLDWYIESYYNEGDIFLNGWSYEVFGKVFTITHCIHITPPEGEEG